MSFCGFCKLQFRRPAIVDVGESNSSCVKQGSSNRKRSPAHRSRTISDDIPTARGISAPLWALRAAACRRGAQMTSAAVADPCETMDPGGSPMSRVAGSFQEPRMRCIQSASAGATSRPNDRCYESRISGQRFSVKRLAKTQLLIQPRFTPAKCPATRSSCLTGMKMCGSFSKRQLGALYQMRAF
jgi:hypothetical protein